MKPRPIDLNTAEKVLQMMEGSKDRMCDFYIVTIALQLRYLNDSKLSKYNITNQQGRLLGTIYMCLKKKNL